MQANDSAGRAKKRLVSSLRDVERFATDFQRDFQKTRRKRKLSSNVRSRVLKTLKSYADRAEALRQAFRPPMTDFDRYFYSIASSGSNSDSLRQRVDRVGRLLDQFHATIDRQANRVADPMTEDEEERFWTVVARLCTAMEDLREYCRQLRSRVQQEKQAVCDPADPELDKLDQACDRILEGIESYGRSVGAGHRDGIRHASHIQDAAAEYLKRLKNALHCVEEVFPNVGENLLVVRKNSDELAAGFEELKSRLGIHALLLNTVLRIGVLPVRLPREAADLAVKIRGEILQVLRDNALATAQVESCLGDEHAFCDTMPGKDIPAYTSFDDGDDRGKKIQVVIDALILLAYGSGPQTTRTVRELATVVTPLAEHRGVLGLKEGTLRVLLRVLGDEFKIIRKIPAQKNRSNQNASDGYRLSLPAQNRYLDRVAELRAELDIWDLPEVRRLLAS